MRKFIEHLDDALHLYYQDNFYPIVAYTTMSMTLVTVGSVGIYLTNNYPYWICVIIGTASASPIIVYILAMIIVYCSYLCCLPSSPPALASTSPLHACASPA